MFSEIFAGLNSAFIFGLLCVLKPLSQHGLLQQRELPYCCHGTLPMLFAKEQRACPITRSSVARKVTRNAPIIFWYTESKFTEQEYIKK